MDQQLNYNEKSNKLQDAIKEANIQSQIENLVKAICNIDLEEVLLIYAPDVISFDVEQTYLGVEAKKEAWRSVFSMIVPPLNYEIRDLAITIGDDVAFSHSYNRLRGKLKNGKPIGVWVRWTACFRKIRGHWLITHEQVSVPVDIESGKAVPVLVP